MLLLAKSNETLTEHTQKVVKGTEGNLRIAGIFHDTGKGTEEFQKVLKGELRQASYRHEVLSAIIYLHVCKLKLIKFNDKVLYAILNHHKKAELDGWERKQILKQKILTDELEEFLAGFGIVADLSALNDKNLLGELFNEVARVFGQLSVTPEHYKLLGELRRRDHLASFLHDYDIVRISNEKTINYFKVRGWELKEFQKRAYDSNADVLIIEAPTGSGKTEASLLYADKFVRSGYTVNYVINNRASLNAMFDRLRRIYGDENVTLLYSHVAMKYYDLLLESYDDEKAKKEAILLAKKSKYMTSPVRLTTIHTLYKLTHNDKNADIILSELDRSVIIIDEVQMLDDEYEKLIDTLNYLMKFTSAKIVIMSATIPNYLMCDVEELAKANNKVMEIIREDDRRKLHYIKLIDDELSVESIEQLVLERKLKNVLIVVNTVKKAIELYEGLKGKFGRVTLLHSRFKFKDRARKEREVIENFNDYDIVITTQVVEASVDISADVIITELAPAPSLVQRFGRANRHNPEEPRKPNVFIFLKVSSRPYRRKALKITAELLESGKLSKEDERRLVKEFYDIMRKQIELDKFLRLSFNDYLSRIRARTVEDSTLVMLNDDYEKLQDADFFEKHKHLIQVSRYVVKSCLTKEKGYLIVEGEYNDETGLVRINGQKSFEML